MSVQHTPPKDSGKENTLNQSDFLGFDNGDGDTPSTLPVDPAVAAQIKSLSRQRAQVHSKLLRIYNAVRNQQAIEPAELNVFVTKLQSAYSEYSKFHSQIVAVVPDSNLATQENEYLNFERYYDWTSTTVQKLIQQQQPTAKPAGPAQVVIHQQPLKAPIPTFDGDYTKWPRFKAMFQDIMAQSRDPNSIKLYHLDKALVGAAAGILDSKTINEGNYNQAWKILTERYENQRVIVETHIRGLLTMNKMSTDSSKELRRLLDECTNHVESLQYLAQEVTGVSELIIVYLLTAALDKSTRKLWEQTLKSGELPKYETTVAFLKSQCQVLEYCENSYPTSGPTMEHPVAIQRSHALTTNSDEALKCDIYGASHRNYQCNTLNSLPHAEKMEKVRLAGICFNCFRKGHRSDQCPSSKTCRKCQKLHHTRLHEDDPRSTQESAANSAVKTTNPDSPGTHDASQPTPSTSTKPAN